MTVVKTRPALFIASSAEGLPAAYAMQENLEYDTEPTVWTQGVFAPGRTVMEALLKHSQSTDFAAFICTADDLVTTRGEAFSAPRDNVIFELGLFIGASDPSRCFIVQPIGLEPLKLPSDLLGVETLGYMDSRADHNLVAALGPACNRIRRAVRDASGEAVARRTYTRRFNLLTLEDFIAAWEAPDSVRDRRVLRAGIPIHVSEDEKGDSTAALQRVFALLESVSDAVLAGQIDEDAARQVFASPISLIWQCVYTYLAPPNHADEWWTPKPKIAELNVRWQQ
jgi:hypothetical protein